MVADVAQCVHLDAAAKATAAALQEYIRRPGALPVYDTIRHTGVWRTLTVRTSGRTGQASCALDARGGWSQRRGIVVVCVLFYLSLPLRLT